MTVVSPFPSAVESAFVVVLPLDGDVGGLAFANALAVQAGDDPVTIFGSLDGVHFAPVAHLQAEQLTTLSLVNVLRADAAGAVVLARFPLR
jgi:hypothetical protein